jgi:hypothetical protein
MFRLEVLEIIESNRPIYALFSLWYGNPLLNYKYNIMTKDAGVEARRVDSHLHGNNILTLKTLIYEGANGMKP